MITLTDAAKAHIQMMLKSKPENAVFRLSIKKTGCSGYQYVPEIVETKNETDIVVSVADFTVCIDEKSAALMKGTQIDYVKKSLGVSQLEFKNPNAESLCGCGESFNLKEAQ